MFNLQAVGSRSKSLLIIHIISLIVLFIYIIDPSINLLIF